jgi:hypothetical protein
MEATARELNDRVTSLNKVLQEICDVPHSQRLVLADNGSLFVIHLSTPLARTVTTDLGGTEVALRLPLPDAEHPRYWIALHELWDWKNRRTLRFRKCGLRLYVGGVDEEALQFLRLEWVAPTKALDGELVYEGSHAGHPHWHIDRSALVGPEEELRSLEALTSMDRPVEEFSDSTVRLDAVPTRLLHDCLWLQKMHLPAQADWMKKEWDGSALPAPHQCEPESPSKLANWWAGALRYLIAELPH